MRLKREYEKEGGPKLVRKRQRLKRVVLINDTNHKAIQITELWFRDFCRELRLKRLAKNLSQQQLARLLGSTQTWISELESGKLNPSLKSLLQLANVLDIEIQVTIKDKRL